MFDLIVDPFGRVEFLGPSLAYLAKNMSEDYKSPRPTQKQYLQIRNKNESEIVATCKRIRNIITGLPEGFQR